MQESVRATKGEICLQKCLRQSQVKPTARNAACEVDGRESRKIRINKKIPWFKINLLVKRRTEAQN